MELDRPNQVHTQTDILVLSAECQLDKKDFKFINF